MKAGDTFAAELIADDGGVTKVTATYLEEVCLDVCLARVGDETHELEEMVDGHGRFHWVTSDRHLRVQNAT